ncbi:hypothetical protein [Candidatus Leptofilum sp.]|uniref:Dph6-related ATP pyrophosphatase n=1 Tax=Candidatus Leptofilum sp. TaxID=3241576 RepID=UPI003B5C0029
MDKPKAIMKLWQQPTRQLAQDFVAQGFRAITVCINEKQLDSNFVGQELDATFFANLPTTVDPCGENGEYHSFIYDGPLFAQPIPIEKGEIVRRTLGAENDKFDTAFWYADLRIKENV